MNFQHAKTGEFYQDEPTISNGYLEDPFVGRILRRLLPQQVFQEVHSDLTRLGQRATEELKPLAMQCERQPPYLEQFDAWGKRVDRVVTCSAWQTMKRISAEEGVVAIGYERPYGELSRIYQFAKLLLFVPVSGGYSCPLAMADGAAKCIESLKLTQFNDVFQHLTSRDPNQFWTSGQWMTERKGGSDVANGNETTAIRQSNGSFKLYGYKWFSSATDSDVALTLGRVADDSGNVRSGTEGLSMFLLRTRLQDGSLNGIQVMKLKDKLGTRGLPTGELLLDGTVAHLVSQEGRGVAAISSMLTITRLYNTLGAVVAMRVILMMARDYSTKRSCFGRPIDKFTLHVDTLATMEVETRGATVLVFELARLLGLSETGKASDEEIGVLRILTPVAKLFTAKRCMSVVSEGLECFGGQGFIETTGIPMILRDAQVLPIWEGTTNILSMDMLRSVATSKGEVLRNLHDNLDRRIDDMWEKATKRSMDNSILDKLKKENDALLDTFISTDDAQVTIRRARILAFAIAHLAIGTLLLEHALSDFGDETSDMEVALRWIRQMPLIQDSIRVHDATVASKSYDMVFDGHPKFQRTQLQNSKL